VAYQYGWLNGAESRRGLQGPDDFKYVLGIVCERARYRAFALPNSARIDSGCLEPSRRDPGGEVIEIAGSSTQRRQQHNQWSFSAQKHFDHNRMRRYIALI
jgi:hypothetical protein